MESGIHFVESRIRDSLGFPYMEQYLTKHLIDKTSTSAGISDLLDGWNYSNSSCSHQLLRDHMTSSNKNVSGQKSMSEQHNNISRCTLMFNAG